MSEMSGTEPSSTVLCFPCLTLPLVKDLGLAAAGTVTLRRSFIIATNPQGVASGLEPDKASAIGILDFESLTNY